MSDDQKYVFDLARKGREAQAHNACSKCRGRDLSAEAEKWQWVARQAARHAAGRDNAAAYIAQMLERYEQRGV